MLAYIESLSRIPENRYETDRPAQKKPTGFGGFWLLHNQAVNLIRRDIRYIFLNGPFFVPVAFLAVSMIGVLELVVFPGLFQFMAFGAPFDRIALFPAVVFFTAVVMMAGRTRHLVFFDMLFMVKLHRPFLHLIAKGVFVENLDFPRGVPFRQPPNRSRRSPREKTGPETPSLSILFSFFLCTSCCVGRQINGFIDINVTITNSM